jgi:hypothetical protein
MIRTVGPLGLSRWSIGLPCDLLLRLLVDLVVFFFQLSNLEVRGSDKSTCSLDLSVIFLLLAP